MVRDLFWIVRRVRFGALHPPGVPAEVAMHQMVTSEETHWWHIAKRRLVRQQLEGRDLNYVIDIGCGGGTLLQELEQAVDTVGVDLSHDVLTHASRWNLPRLVAANADSLPFTDELFDAALALDVLEHYERPEQMLREIKRVLRPGGWLIVTVPAFDWMWSYADHLLGHYRRYTKNELCKDLVEGGYLVERVTYFHSWLLPIAWLFRKLRTLLRKTESADDFPLPGFLNTILVRMADWERRVIRSRDLRLGLSLFAVASTSREARPAAEQTTTADERLGAYKV